MAAIFTHITFTVSDFERSIAFYKNVCEMDVARDRRLEGGSTVWLGPKTNCDTLPPYVFVIEQGEVINRLDHLAFQCDTRDEVTAKATLGVELGVLHEGPVDLGGSVGYFALLRDPDGHLVEFTHGQPIAGVRAAA
jgi:lactoylglutathione lyase